MRYKSQSDLNPSNTIEVYIHMRYKSRIFENNFTIRAILRWSEAGKFLQEIDRHHSMELILWWENFWDETEVLLKVFFVMVHFSVGFIHLVRIQSVGINCIRMSLLSSHTCIPCRRFIWTLMRIYSKSSNISQRNRSQ